jgi:hypothetical protein
MQDMQGSLSRKAPRPRPDLASAALSFCFMILCLLQDSTFAKSAPAKFLSPAIRDNTDQSFSSANVCKSLGAQQTAANKAAAAANSALLGVQVASIRSLHLLMQRDVDQAFARLIKGLDAKQCAGAKGVSTEGADTVEA